ncbi:MAG: hypothetical protein ACE5MG_00615 [Candidatus Methylomirabilales bacterium]
MESVIEERAAVASLLFIPPDHAGAPTEVSPGTMLLGLPLLRRSV